ncbi:hypothetical protein SDC9_101134 [bioreactor metagenome]|uniref:Uncharacterized protein n=1 Tax=bioreactor metagenome TaxID=1076179 RepID=A0A645AN64_9ZZZZ
MKQQHRQRRQQPDDQTRRHPPIAHPCPPPAEQQQQSENRDDGAVSDRQRRQTPGKPLIQGKRVGEIAPDRAVKKQQRQRRHHRQQPEPAVFQEILSAPGQGINHHRAERQQIGRHRSHRQQRRRNVEPPAPCDPRAVKDPPCAIERQRHPEPADRVTPQRGRINRKHPGQRESAQNPERGPRVIRIQTPPQPEQQRQRRQCRSQGKQPPEADPVEQARITTVPELEQQGVDDLIVGYRVMGIDFARSQGQHEVGQGQRLVKPQFPRQRRSRRNDAAGKRQPAPPPLDQTPPPASGMFGDLHIT